MVREESVKRWRKEQWINDPWLEGGLGPVTTQERREAMIGDELPFERRGESRMGRRKEVLRHRPENKHTGSAQMA